MHFKMRAYAPTRRQPSGYVQIIARSPRRVWAGLGVDTPSPATFTTTEGATLRFLDASKGALQSWIREGDDALPTLLEAAQVGRWVNFALEGSWALLKGEDDQEEVVVSL